MRALIISDSQSQFGLSVLAETEQALDLWGYTYQRFPQTPGSDITGETWRSLGIRPVLQGKWQNRPGAWGCLISHYRLWTEVAEAKDPVIVLEHDALAQQAFPGDLDTDQCVWKLWKPQPQKFKPTVGYWSRGSWAYTLTPRQAQSLIGFTRQHGALVSDKQLGTLAVAVQHWREDVFLHNPRPRHSTVSGSSARRLSDLGLDQ